MKFHEYLPMAMAAAVEAGMAVMDVYRQASVPVEEKPDKTPLTLADRRSHEIITRRLSKTSLPILSEEGAVMGYEVRKDWSLFWMVDPLDGTKEFIKRNGEFTINIALIEDQIPALGVVYAPSIGRLYFAARKFGAYALDIPQTPEFRPSFLDDLIDDAKRISIKKIKGGPLVIVGSRSHATPDLDAYVAKKRAERGDVEFVSAGSSLKICRVAEGVADVYPRLGPTMEWDTAAGQAIAVEAGAMVFDSDTKEPVLYNKPDLHNPWFFVSNGNH